MKYVITFDMPSSHVLDSTGTRSTFHLDEAMTFKDQRSAESYLLEHSEAIKEIGTGAIPSKLP